MMLSKINHMPLQYIGRYVYLNYLIQSFLYGFITYKYKLFSRYIYRIIVINVNNINNNNINKTYLFMRIFDITYVFDR